MRHALAAVALLGLACGCGDAAGNKATDTDNTAKNERDADGDTMTPFDQSNEQADLDLLKEIRAEILEIEDLSVSGENVKIFTNDGRVLLRGPVETAAERDAIVAVVNDVAGAGKLTNQLEVDTAD
jgi:hyperosmotically inducible periplasmic protein